MKETHIFYTPDIDNTPNELPAEEAGHAVRVLRMREGDPMLLTDGKGHFYDAHITLCSNKHCQFTIDNQWNDHKLWNGGIHLAVAPTKNMDRMEWFAEKATEIGVDGIHLLLCDNSERKVVKTERLEKIVVSAMKQSHKAYKPVVEPLTKFKEFVNRPFNGQKFIAHCYSPEEIEGNDAESIHLSGRNFLGDLLNNDGDAVVLIGPEGDFSIAEVNEAIRCGFQPISLGESRLRTETAALVAVHLMYLAKRNKSHD